MMWQIQWNGVCGQDINEEETWLSPWDFTAAPFKVGITDTKNDSAAVYFLVQINQTNVKNVWIKNTVTFMHYYLFLQNEQF